MEREFEVICILFFVFYLVGRLCLGIYFTQTFNKAYRKKDLLKLLLLKKEFKKKSFLWWIYPISEKFLSKVQSAIESLQKEAEQEMGLDLDFLIREAEDEYRNLNGLTTSEEDEECV